MAAYSTYSHLPSIPGGRLPYPQPGGVPCREVRDPQTETWSLTLREEHRLRLFGNKVLRKIFGAKKDEITGEWRKLHNAELSGFSRLENRIDLME